MQNRLECNITGRVQMVMFRDFACRKARKLGLVGVVENMDDNSLHIVSEGDEEVLLKFLIFLSKGPIFARVDDIKKDWMKPTGEFHGFNIKY